jgi:hypothetical protein
MQQPVIAFVGLVGAAVMAGALRATPARGEEKAADETAVTAARQAFVGEWRLNQASSDDPRVKMREGRPQGGPGGWGGEPPEGGGPGGRGGGRRGGGWGGGRPGRGMDRPRMGGSGVAPGGMLFGADRIAITNLTPEITIVAPEGELRTLHADGKGYKTSSGATVKTRWDGARLLVETKGDRGEMKEAWAVSSEPRQLTVLLEVDRPFGGTVRIRRVFDPLVAERQAPPASAPATTEPDAPNPPQSPAP